MVQRIFYHTTLDRAQADVPYDMARYLANQVVVKEDSVNNFVYAAGFSAQVCVDAPVDYCVIRLPESSPVFPQGYVAYFLDRVDREPLDTYSAVTYIFSVDAWGTLRLNRSYAEINGLLARGHDVPSNAGRLLTPWLGEFAQIVSNGDGVRPIYLVNFKKSGEDIKRNGIIISPYKFYAQKALSLAVRSDVEGSFRGQTFQLIGDESTTFSQVELLAIQLIPGSTPLGGTWGSGGLPVFDISTVVDGISTPYGAIGFTPYELDVAETDTYTTSYTVAVAASNGIVRHRIGNAGAFLEAPAHDGDIYATVSIQVTVSEPSVAVFVDLAGQRLDVTDSTRVGFGALADATAYQQRNVTDALRGVSTAVGLAGSIAAGSPVGIAQSLLGGVELVSGIATRAFSTSSNEGAGIKNTAISVFPELSGTHTETAFCGAVGLFDVYASNHKQTSRERAAFGYAAIEPSPSVYRPSNGGLVGKFYQFTSANAYAYTMPEVRRGVEAMFERGVRIWDASYYLDWGSLYAE